MCAGRVARCRGPVERCAREVGRCRGPVWRWIFQVGRRAGGFWSLFRTGLDWEAGMHRIIALVAAGLALSGGRELQAQHHDTTTHAARSAPDTGMMKMLDPL